jgi:hypothetical protein
MSTALSPSTDAAASETPADAQLLSAVLRAAPGGCAWAWYRSSSALHLLARDGPVAWPATIARDDVDALCAREGWCCRAVGQGEHVLGWLLAPRRHAADPAFVAWAGRLAAHVQTDALARAQRTQRVLYEIAYLASSMRERAGFVQQVHARLGTLIDAENFYFALYDRNSNIITYPY